MKNLSSLLPSIRKYLDPIVYFGLRPLRTVLFYWAYIFAVEISTATIPFGDPEMWNYSPWKYHLCCTVSNLLLFCFMTGIFVLYDATARRRFCRKPPEETHRFSEHLGILRSYEFLCHAIGLAVLPLFFGLDCFSHPLFFLFPIDSLSKEGIYLRYLLCVFPLILLLDLPFRIKTRTFWRSLTDSEANALSPDPLKLIILGLFIAFGYGFIASFYLLLLPYLLLLLGKMVGKPFFWITATILILLVLFGKRLRAIHRQRKFLKKLRKVCSEEEIELSPIQHPHRSIFFYDPRPTFKLRLSGRTYAVKLFPALTKSAEMVFVDETSGYFKKSLRIRRNEFFSSRRKFEYGFDIEDADQKILLLLPSPQVLLFAHTETAFSSENKTYIRETGRFQKLFDASPLFDMTVFSGQAFLHALERNCLHIRDTEQ